MIGDDISPLGSASPIVIHVDENWCYDEIDQLSSHAGSTRALPFTEATWHDTIVAEDTQSNAIYTGNYPSSFGFVSNPTGIHENWLDFDTDTEVMATPNVHDSADECGAVASASVCMLEASQDPKDPHLGLLSTNNPQYDDKAPETSERPFSRLKSYSTPGYGRHENSPYTYTCMFDPHLHGYINNDFQAASRTWATIVLFLKYPATLACRL
jgi:hypothetical protein